MARQIVLATEGIMATHEYQMPPVLNWAVLWLKDDTIIEKWCDDDLTEALRIYELARKAGKRMATLRCANYFFPPPEKYRWRLKTVKRHGKRRYVEVEPLTEINLRGVYWCGYCVQFRRLERRQGFMNEDGEYVPHEAWYCPICGITHQNLNRGYRADDGTMKPCNPGVHRLERRRRARRGKGQSKRRKR